MKPSKIIINKEKIRGHKPFYLITGYDAKDKQVFPTPQADGERCPYISRELNAIEAWFVLTNWQH